MADTMTVRIVKSNGIKPRYRGVIKHIVGGF